MAWGALYFLAKVALHFLGVLRIDMVRSFALLLFLVLPIPEKWRWRSLLKTLRIVLGALLAFLLLWRESWLPPIGTVVSFLVDPVTRPSFAYVLVFLRGAVNVWMLLGLCVFGAFAALSAYMRLRLWSLAVLALAFVAMWDPTTITGNRMRGELDSFYRDQSGLTVRFDKAVPGKPDFDIIFVHVCSISWDDLRTVGLAGHPFFSQFDYVFEKFNTVSSYSNPAGIRLFRATCGQTSHGALYRDAPPECFLLEGLRQVGYQTSSAANHDGLYARMAVEMMKYGRADAWMDVKGLPLIWLDFDDSPIFSDLASLQRAWGIRQSSGAKKAAIYYNTISLHGGVHHVGQAPAGLREKNYANRLQAMIADLTSFFAALESSGRNVVVVFVSEHGAALQGTRIQAPDLRDIPLPQITMGPVAVKLIGPGRKSLASKQHKIDKPASFLALARLLAGFIERSPFGPDAAVPEAVIESLPETPFVAESENAVILKKGTSYWYQAKGKDWVELPEDVLPPKDSR